MKQRNFIISIIVMFIIMLSFNTILAVENYTNFIPVEEQDFSQNITKTIIQDKKGYMWFGSNDGLTKYDGYKVKTYRQTPFEKNTLLDNYIIDLEEDAEDNIWIGTNNGLTKLDSKQDKFTHYKKEYKRRNISSNKISVIFKDRMSNIWVGTADSGLHKYDKEKDKFISYDLNLTSQYITDINQDNEGHLWIGTEDGLNRLNPETREIRQYQYDKYDENTISGNYITAICQDMYGEVWIGTKNEGLSKINFETGIIKRYLKDENDSYSIGSNAITSIIEDRNGYLWIGTSHGGLAKFDRAKEYFIKRVSDSKGAKSNHQNNILTLYQDDTGLIWVGVEYGGINKFNPLASFQNYSTVGEFGNNMNDNNILSIYKDKTGIIWAGTKNGGVNKLDLNSRSVKYYTHDVYDENSITSNTINYILEDSEGLMWFGTDMGLNKLDKQTNEIKRYVNSKNKNSIINNYINYIFEDSYKNIWIGTEGGVSKYDRERDEFIQYSDVGIGFKGENVTAIFSDTDKNVWIGTFHDGLKKYDRKEKKIITYKNDPEDTSTISNEQIKSIVEDDKGNIWIATSNGLNKFDKKTQKFKVFTEKDQLKSNFISAMLKHDNYLWISSNDEITKFDLREEKPIKSYSVIDGLQGNYFNSGAAYKSEDGQLLFGGTEGFNTIYPDKEKKRYYTPKILLNTFVVNGEDIDTDDKREIVLNYDQNKIFFEFGLIDYKKPYNNSHAFKLEGYDKDWNNVKNRNYGVYNNLKPGSYKLRIKGTNSEGVETKKDIELDITINPPIWKTKIAYLLYFLILLSLIYLFFNYVKLLEKIINERTNQLNKTNNRLLEEIKQRKNTEEVLKSTISENENLFKEKMEVENFRNDFFINLSHELRTPLNMIIGSIQLSEMYLRDDNLEESTLKIKGHFKTMRKNCYRLLKTVNNIIDVAKIETKQYELNMKLINIVYLVEDVVNSTVSYAKYRNIDIAFDTQVEEVIVKCDHVEIERVILNILSNAIKYNDDKGNVWVNIFKAKENIEIIIKDDGIGIPKEKQKFIFEKFKRVNEQQKLGSGIGLSLSKLLIDMHGGEIEFKSKEGQGSEFIIRLPIYNIKYSEYKEILDLEAIDKKSMDLEIEMSEIK